MNLSKAHSFTQVGKDCIVVDAQDGAVGVIKPLIDNLPVIKFERLTIDSRRLHDGPTNGQSDHLSTTQ